MFKTLLKKQLLELNTFYFINKKTGEKRSVGGIIGYIALMLFVFVSLGFSFLSIGMLLCKPLTDASLNWFYFALVALITVLLGTFGSVFNTYAGIYRAKDNELLLSMPIKPTDILSVRILGTYFTGLLFSSFAYIPLTAVYWFFAKPDILSVILSIFLFFVLGIFISVLTCLLGYLVACISPHFKNKTFATVIFSLLFISVYYVFFFNIQNYLTQLLTNAEKLSEKFKNYAYILYLFGNAASGSLIDFLIIFLINAVLFALLFWIMSKTYIKTALSNTVNTKSSGKKQEIKLTGIKSALLKKEYKRLLSSSVYMLNMGLGLIIAPIVAVIAVIKADTVYETLQGLQQFIPDISDFLVVLGIAFTVMINGIGYFTAASVSLEGKNLWILKSLPVKAEDIFFAKIKMHTTLNSIINVIISLAVIYIIKADIISAVFMLAFSFIFVRFSALFGLILNLKFPNFTWTNETVPVKQGLPVTIALFGTWAIAVIITAAYYFLSKYIPLTVFLSIILAILVTVTVVLRRFVKLKGEEIFKNL